VFTVLDEILDCCQSTFTVLDEIEIDIFDTQTILCDKFFETWTILAEINNDFNGTFTVLEEILDCCQSTFTVLDEIEIDIFDTQTILCDKFFETWTILAEINNDFNGTFTVLDEILDCCQSTFTVLDEIEIDIFDTQTILCDKFFETWTILAEINNDFNGTFTVLDEILDCCQSTFTVLDEIEIDIFDTQTILCDKFFETWTILDNLQITASVDLSTVFTVLDEILDCCQSTFTVLDEIEIDIFDTQTILCDKFFETWTILAEINADFSGTFTVLDANTQQLETILAGVCTPTVITQMDIGTTTYIITSSGYYVFAENIVFSPVSGQPAIEIAADDVIIDMCDRSLSQGNATSGVDGFRIRGGSAADPRRNVVIRNGSVTDFSRAGITVGTNSVTPSDRACELIALDDLVIFNCGIRGIEFLGTSDTIDITKSEINQCNITSCCTSVSADFALTLSFVQDIKVIDCCINDNGSLTTGLIAVNIVTSTKCIFENVAVNCNMALTFTGFNINNSQECIFTECLILTNSVQNNFVGFVMQGGPHVQGNMCNNCSVFNNVSTNGSLRGFELSVGVTRNILRFCLAENNVAISAVSTANAFGFNFDRITFCSIIECKARYNRAPGDGTTNITAGFNISTSGASGTGNKNCEFFNNIATSNNAFNDDRSFGFRTVSDSGGNENNAYVSNVAIRNGPVTPIRQTQIVSTAGAGSSPGGVPNGSVRDVTISNLNGDDIEFSNIRII
ncbi:MAG: hypothetical protein WDZ41_03640, partial [Candidatus Babeliales bacterium]